MTDLKLLENFEKKVTIKRCELTADFIFGHFTSWFRRGNQNENARAG